MKREEERERERDMRYVAGTPRESRLYPASPFPSLSLAHDQAFASFCLSFPRVTSRERSRGSIPNAHLGRVLSLPYVTDRIENIRPFPRRGTATSDDPRPTGAHRAARTGRTRKSAMQA